MQQDTHADRVKAIFAPLAMAYTPAPSVGGRDGEGARGELIVKRGFFLAATMDAITVDAYGQSGASIYLQSDCDTVKRVVTDYAARMVCENWSGDDQGNAMNEGWCIDERGAVVRENGKFADDTAAFDRVRELAINGDLHALRAVISHLTSARNALVKLLIEAGAAPAEPLPALQPSFIQAPKSEPERHVKITRTAEVGTVAIINTRRIDHESGEWLTGIWENCRASDTAIMQLAPNTHLLRVRDKLWNATGGAEPPADLLEFIKRARSAGMMFLMLDPKAEQEWLTG